MNFGPRSAMAFAKAASNSSAVSQRTAGMPSPLASDTQSIFGSPRSSSLLAEGPGLPDPVRPIEREGGSVSGDIVIDDLLQPRLSEAQKAADQYLEGVTEVLGEAHSVFAKQMEITLREGNRAFHQELAQATGLLKGAIQDLGDVLDNVRTPA